MGNVHTIVQTEPVRTQGGGVAIQVRRSCHDLIRAKQDQYNRIGPFHEKLRDVGVQLEVPNLGRAEDVGHYEDRLLYFCIGSNYKMDYDRYCEFVRILHEIAPCLEDVRFYVNDEIGYCGFLDEFTVRAGRLEYRRLVEAGCSDIDEYLTEQQIGDESNGQ